MKRARIPFLVAVLVLLCQGWLSAQADVGTMTLNKGVVKLRRAKIDTLYQTVGQQIPVQNLDEIQTGKDSNVTIDLKAQTDKLELYSQSFFKIDQVTGESSQVSMSIGKARFKIQAGTRPLVPRDSSKKRFQVKTANAIVGVKGTEFVMAAGADVTSVLTIEGVVDVASVAAPDIQVEVGENQASQIKQASTPTAPVTVPPSVKDSILSTDSPAVFNNVSFGATVSATEVKPEQKQKSEGSGEKPADQKSQASQSGPGGGAEGQGGAPAASGSTVLGAAAALTSDGDSNPDSSAAAGTGDESATDGETGQAGAAAPSDSESNADLTGTGGDDSAFDASPSGLGAGDAINLETIETADLDNIEIEEPDIDPEDVLDIDDLIEEVEDSTGELQDEIEAIQEEVLENQLQRIQIGIRYSE